MVLPDVSTDQLAIDVVRTLGDLALEDAAGVVGEEGSVVVTKGDAGDFVGVVVRGKVTAEERLVGGERALGLCLLSELLATSKGRSGEATAGEVGGAGTDGVGLTLEEFTAFGCFFDRLITPARPSMSSRDLYQSDKKGTNVRIVSE